MIVQSSDRMIGPAAAGIRPRGPGNEPMETKHGLHVILFSDIVDSVAHKSRLGTTAYTAKLRRHRTLFEEALLATGGTLVQHTGDGFLAVFNTPSQAAECALIFQGLMTVEPWGDAPLEVRIGIHQGEVLHDALPDGETQYVGLAIDLAGRVTNLAGGRQILLTRAVFNDARQFIRKHPPVPGGADPGELKWVAHGAYRFKGEEEPMDVFEVGATAWARLQTPPGSDKAIRCSDIRDDGVLGWRPAAGLTVPGKPDWTLQKKLGDGGFGEVWLGEQAASGLRHAFKFCFDAGRLRSFKREITLFSLLKGALGQRNDLAQMHDIRMDESPYYIESEYYPEGNLQQWAAANTPARGTLLRLFVETARAVGAAHSVGVVHKDVKPSNIFITRDAAGTPHAVLGDFGIGVLEDAIRLGHDGKPLLGFTEECSGDNDSSRTGTRLYAAPEYLAGAKAAPAGDMYALGVLLYQMAVGDLGRPLATGWRRDIASEVLGEDIAGAVDKDPARRWPLCETLAARVEFLPQRELEARRRRWFRWVSLAAAGGLALAGVVMLAWWRELGHAHVQQELRRQEQQAKIEAQQARDRAETSRRDVAVQYARGLLSKAQTLAAARRDAAATAAAVTAFAMLPDTAPERAALQAVLAEHSLRRSWTLLGHAPALLPDAVNMLRSGDRLYVAYQNGVLDCWSLENARRLWRRDYHTGANVLADAALSRDGRTLVLGVHGGTLLVCRAADGDLQTAIPMPNTVLRSVCISGGDDPVVGISTMNTEQLLTLRLADGKVASYTGFGWYCDRLAVSGPHVVAATPDGDLHAWRAPGAPAVSWRVTPPESKQPPRALVISPDAVHLAVLDGDGRLVLSRLDRPEQPLPKTATPPFLTVAFESPDVLAGLHADGSWGRYAVAPFRRLDAIPCRPAPAAVRQTETWPDGRQLLVLTDDSSLLRYDLRDGRLLGDSRGQAQTVTAATPCSGGLLAIGNDGAVRHVDARTGQITKVRPLSEHALVRIATDTDGQTAAVLDAQGAVRLLPTGEPLPLPDADNTVEHENVRCAVALAGRLVGIGTTSGRVEVWDRSARKTVWSERLHAKAVTGLQFQGGKLYSAGADGTVAVADAAGGGNRAVLYTAGRPVSDLCLDETGGLWLAEDRHVTALDAAGGKRWQSPPFDRPVVAVTRQGDVLAAVDAGGGIRLLYARGGETLSALSVAGARSATLSPDGRTLWVAGRSLSGWTATDGFWANAFLDVLRQRGWKPKAVQLAADRIAVISEDATAALLRLDCPEMRLVPLNLPAPHPSGKTLGYAISPDARRVAVFDTRSDRRDASIVWGTWVFDLQTGEKTGGFKGPGKPRRADMPCFAADGRRIAVLQDGHAAVFSFGDPVPTAFFGEDVLRCDWAGETLLTLGRDGALRAWTADGAPRWTLAPSGSDDSALWGETELLPLGPGRRLLRRGDRLADIDVQTGREVAARAFPGLRHIAVTADGTLYTLAGTSLRRSRDLRTAGEEIFQAGDDSRLLLRGPHLLLCRNADETAAEFTLLGLDGTRIARWRGALPCALRNDVCLTGRNVLVLTAAGSLHVYSLDGRTTRVIAAAKDDPDKEAPATVTALPAVSPDGTRALVVRRTAAALVDLDSGVETPLDTDAEYAGFTPDGRWLFGQSDYSPLWHCPSAGGTRFFYHTDFGAARGGVLTGDRFLEINAEGDGSWEWPLGGVLPSRRLAIPGADAIENPVQRVARGAGGIVVAQLRDGTLSLTDGKESARQLKPAVDDFSLAGGIVAGVRHGQLWTWTLSEPSGEGRRLDAAEPADSAGVADGGVFAGTADGAVLACRGSRAEPLYRLTAPVQWLTGGAPGWILAGNDLQAVLLPLRPPVPEAPGENEFSVHGMDILYASPQTDLSGRESYPEPAPRG